MKNLGDETLPGPQSSDDPRCWNEVDSALLGCRDTEDFHRFGAIGWMSTKPWNRYLRAKGRRNMGITEA
jgi:hypothetical protein